MKKYLMFTFVTVALPLGLRAEDSIKITNLAAGSNLAAVEAPSVAVESAATSTASKGTVASVTTTTTTSVAPAISAAPAAVVPAPSIELTKQPTTVVEATPLTTSRAEELRKQREQSEIETEQRIVEKLEESRMEAEKQRQAAILGSFGAAQAVKPEEQKAQQPQPEPAPAPVAPAVAPVPVVVEVKTVPQTEFAPAAAPQNSGAQIEDVRAAVREELAASQKDMLPKAPEHTNQSYFRGTVGTIDYDSADIRTIGAVGASFGKLFDDRWALEISVMSASAYIDESNFLYRKLQQFSLGLGTKFMVLPGSRVRPNLGFEIDYVNRSYSDLTNTYSGGTYPNSDDGSWAVDYGISAGVDFVISENINLGLEYKFLTNLTYEFRDEFRNTPAYRNAFGSIAPLEERDSTMFGVSFKYLF